LERENGLTLEGILQDGKVNCGCCSFQPWGAAFLPPPPALHPQPRKGRTSERENKNKTNTKYPLPQQLTQQEGIRRLKETVIFNHPLR
jgi:hypothetical protein